MKCINAANQVFGSSGLCSEAFTIIMEARSVESVSAAAQDLCTNGQCSNPLQNFVTYLAACDGLDDNDVRVIAAT